MVAFIQPTEVNGENLRAVLDFARTDECVLLLNKFDAVAKRRNDPAEW
jgi:hypothetical protein